MSKKRRKSDHSDGMACIIHIESVGNTDYGNFVPLTDEEFEALLEIKEKRLAQPADSVHRKTIMCNQIHSDFSDTFGYHKFVLQIIYKTYEQVEASYGIRALSF